MPKYLFKACYTTEGAKGLLKDGGSKRRESAQKLFESLGGKLEAFYFAFGESDAFVIGDIPDASAAAAASLAISSTGAVTTMTTVLLTPEEMDRAVAKAPKYTAPGH
jgi:uncharacterized protein with GYD domain